MEKAATSVPVQYSIKAYQQPGEKLSIKVIQSKYIVGKKYFPYVGLQLETTII
jgi:hypothetical protein